MIFKNKEQLNNLINHDDIRSKKFYNNICKAFSILENSIDYKSDFFDKLNQKIEKEKLITLTFKKEIDLYEIFRQNIEKNKNDILTKVNFNISKNENEKNIKKNLLSSLKKELSNDFFKNLDEDKFNTNKLINELKENKLRQLKSIKDKEPGYILEKNKNIETEKNKIDILEKKVLEKKKSLKELKDSNEEQLNFLKQTIENEYEAKKSLIKTNHKLLIDIYNPIVLKIENQTKESVKVFDNIINSKILKKQQEIKDLEVYNKDNILSINIKENKELLKLENLIIKTNNKYNKKEKEINDKYINEQKILEEKKQNLHNDVSLEKITNKFKKLKNHKDQSLINLEKDKEKENNNIENKKNTILEKHKNERYNNEILYNNNKLVLLKELKELNEKKGILVQYIKNIFELKKFNIYNQFILHSNFDDKNIEYCLNQKSLDLSITEHTSKKNEINYKFDILRTELDYNINILKYDHNIKKHIALSQEKFLNNKMLFDLYNHKFSILNENVYLNHEKFKIYEKNKFYNQIDLKDSYNYLELESLENQNNINKINLIKKYFKIFIDLNNSYYNNFLYNLRDLIENQKKYININILFIFDIFKNYSKNINDNINISKNVFEFLTKNKTDFKNIKLENVLSNSILDIRNYNLDNVKDTNFLNEYFNNFSSQIKIFDNNDIKTLNEKILFDIKKYYTLLEKEINNYSNYINLKYNEYNNYKNRKLSVKFNKDNNNNLDNIYNLSSVLNKEISLISRKIDMYENILTSNTFILENIKNIYKNNLNFATIISKLINNYLEHIKNKSSKEFANILYNFNFLKETYIEKYNLIVEKYDLNNSKKIEQISKNEVKLSIKIRKLITKFKNDILYEYTNLFSKIKNSFLKEKNNIKSQDIITNSNINLLINKLNQDFNSFKHQYQNFINFKITKFNERKFKKIKVLEVKLVKNKIYLKNFEKLIKSKQDVINKNIFDVVNYNHNILQNEIKKLTFEYNKNIKNYKKQIIQLDEYYEEVQDTIEEANDNIIKNAQYDLDKAKKSIKIKFNILKKEISKIKA